MSYLPDSRVKWLVIHYSATPVEHDVPVSVIDRMHRKRGFKGTGYHFYIRKDGTIEIGRDLSEPGRFETGAHSLGENDKSIGICYEGGVSIADLDRGFDTRTKAQKDAMIRLLDELLVRFPKARVEGHKDMPGAATQCPGFNAAAWWAEVQQRRVPWWQKILQAFTGRKGAAA